MSRPKPTKVDLENTTQTAKLPQKAPSFTLKSDNEETESLFCQSPINKNKLLFVVLFVLKKKYIDLILKTKNKFLFFI